MEYHLIQTSFTDRGLQIMAEHSRRERTIAIATMTVNTVISFLLVMAVVFLFHQVTLLKEDNNIVRNKWQRLLCTKMNTEVNNVKI